MDTTKIPPQIKRVLADLEKKAAITRSKNGSTPPPEKPTGLTSELTSESPRQIPPDCPDCHGAGWFRPVDAEPGSVAMTKLVRCENPIHATDRVERLAKASALLEADTKTRLSDLTVTRENREMINAARQMIDDPGGWLYIWGGPGNAKSKVLIAIVNEINAAGNGPALYIKFSHLVNLMRDAFSEKSYRQKKAESGIDSDNWQNLGYLDRFERLKEIPVLAIDELDKARLTEFAEEFRFDFLDERYRLAEHRIAATIFASQTPPVELPDPLRSRVEDGRFKVIHNQAGDARPEMRHR